jgi:hypothetical protein
VTRRNWTDLAIALARVRKQLEGHATRARSDLMFVAHRERMLGIDLAVRVVCRTLRRQSRRFDGRHFMRAYLSAAK